MKKTVIHSEYIRKHRHYLDARIQVLASTILSDNAGDEPIACDIITRIMLHLAYGTPPGHIDADAADAVDELYQLYRRWDITRDGDMLGYIYQQLKSSAARKNEGQFFTPPDVVDYIVEHAIAPGETGITVLDPACGSGQFIVSCFNRLFSNFVQRGWDPNDAALHICTRCLFGIDIDPVSVAIARCNLAHVASVPIENIHNIITGNFLRMNEPPFPSDILSLNRFTTIVGNPPWGARFSPEEKNHYRRRYLSAASGINSFTLFIEKSIMHLSDGGMLGFLVPEAYLNIKAHRSSRRLALDNTSIRGIALWGDRFKKVYAPAVSIHLQKETRHEKRNRNIVHIHTRTTARNGTALLVPQAAYENTHENIFTIHYSRQAVSLLSAIDDGHCFFLKDRVRFFLGIVTGNNPMHISRQRTSQHTDPIIVGKDMHPFSIKFSGHHFKFDPATLQQVAPGDLYITPHKVLYKFIGRQLTFAVDTYGYYSLNNVNGFVPVDPHLDPDSLVALLNSRLMQYYYQQNFFTVKVLRGNLERLPLRSITGDAARMLKRLSIEMRESGITEGTTRENMEDIIFFRYGISDRDAHRITDTLASPAEAS